VNNFKELLQTYKPTKLTNHKNEEIYLAETVYEFELLESNYYVTYDHKKYKVEAVLTSIGTRNVSPRWALVFFGVHDTIVFPDIFSYDTIYYTLEKTRYYQLVGTHDMGTLSKVQDRPTTPNFNDKRLRGIPEFVIKMMDSDAWGAEEWRNEAIFVNKKLTKLNVVNKQY